MEEKELDELDVGIVGNDPTDIRNSNLMVVYKNINEDGNTSMVSILQSFSHNTSYNTVKRIVDNVFQINGKNRRVITEWDDDEPGVEEDFEYNVKAIESADEIIGRILIKEISDYIKELEENSKVVDPKKKGDPDTPIKSIMAKFIQLGFFYRFSDLYYPKEFEPIILRYRNYIEQFSDFYKKVILEIRKDYPESKLIGMLETYKNEFIMKGANELGSTLYSMASANEIKIFSKLRAEYMEIKNPNIRRILAEPEIDLTYVTYNRYIVSVMSDLISNLSDPELKKKFNQIVLIDS